MQEIVRAGEAGNSPSVSPSARTGREKATTTQGRRRLAPDARRTELIDAAMRLLRAGSDEPNWVAAVTGEAGAAKGTFYFYFSSWPEMLATVRQNLIERCDEPIREALNATDPVDWWAVLEETCGRFVDVATEFGRHHALIFHSALPPEAAGESRSGPTLLAAAIERGVAEGQFGPVDVEAQAHLLFSAVHAAADAILAGGDRQRWIEACLALARGVLAPPGSDASSRPHPAHGTSQS